MCHLVHMPKSCANTWATETWVVVFVQVSGTRDFSHPSTSCNMPTPRVYFILWVGCDVLLKEKN